MVLLLLPLNKMLSVGDDAAAEDAADATVAVSIIDIWLLSSILESFCDVNGNPMLIFNISSMINIGGTRNITSTKPSIFVRTDIVTPSLMFCFPSIYLVHRSNSNRLFSIPYRFGTIRITHNIFYCYFQLSRALRVPVSVSVSISISRLLYVGVVLDTYWLALTYVFVVVSSLIYPLF